MRKIFIFSLLIILCASLFAAEDDLSVTLTVEELPVQVQFRLSEYTNPSDDIKEDPTFDTKLIDGETRKVLDLTSENSKTIYVAARTNSANSFKMYLKYEDLYRYEENTKQDTYSIPLTVEGAAGKVYYSGESETISLSAPIETDDDKLQFEEGASEKKGLRAISYPIKLSVKPDDLNKAVEGGYRADLTLTTDAI